MIWGPPQGKQLRAIAQSNSRINLAHGAVRSSKTVGFNIRWIQYIALMNALKVKGDLLMWGKTERTLKRNVIEPMREFINNPNVFNLNSGEGILTLWGRRIYLVGANDERAENKIRGGTFLGAYGDELSLTPESFFKMALSRLSLEGAKLFGTTNPDSPYHYLKTEFIDREDELDLTAFHFLLEDNPHLPASYVEELKKEYSGLWYKRFILGLWVMAAGAIYDMWEDSLVLRRDYKKDGIATKGSFFDVDYGTSNPCTFSKKTWWKLGDRTHIHVDREYWYDSKEEGKQKTDEQYLDDLADFMGRHAGKPQIFVDPSAASFIVAGRERGFNMIEADNTVIDGIRFVSSLLAQGRLTFDPTCKHTIRNYQSYIWDEKAQKKGEDKPLKEHDHACDRDRYGVFTLFGGEQQTIGVGQGNI